MGLEAPEKPSRQPGPAAQRKRALIALFAGLSPALLALVLVRGFTSQDGPAHLYNSHILATALDGGGQEFHRTYEVQWRPLPNWAGHALTAALLKVGVPPLAADRTLMAMTLIGFAGSVFWLRGKVARWDEAPLLAFFPALLAMNLCWFLGFHSFLLGASLAVVSLGKWWAGRDQPNRKWLLCLSFLLLLGYFAHAVSFGITILRLVTLATFTPGPSWLRRGSWTILAILPTVPLALFYHRLMREGGGMAPGWVALKSATSLSNWKEQIAWVDPISLGSRFALPFSVDCPRIMNLWLSPVLLCGIALGAMGLGTARCVSIGSARAALRTRRGWIVLAGLLILLGTLGPDTLGPRHGHYLAQRFLLVGMVALFVVVDMPSPGLLYRVAAGTLALATAVQCAFLWDYAIQSDRLVETFLAAKPSVGENERIGSLIIDLRQPFRANPLRHLSCLFGIGTGNVIWGNYESAQYYFPVQIRRGIPHPPVLAFEEISVLDAPWAGKTRASNWRGLLEANHQTIDRLVVWGRDPRLDGITSRWYEPVGQNGKLRVLRRKVPGKSTSTDSKSMRAGGYPLNQTDGY